MIRKAIIVVLTLAAVGTGTLYAVSFARVITWRDRDPADILMPTTWAQTRIPLCFECQIRDGKIAAGHVYKPCGNPRNRQFRFAGIEFANLVEKWERGWLVEKAVLIAPAWILPVLFAAYPSIAFIRGPVRRHRRRKRGLCLKCGYDLTGNVTGVCSECGTEVEPA